MNNFNESNNKPKLIIDFDNSANKGLLAHNCLANLKESVSFHEDQDTRHPLGIYNISTTRIFKKIQRAAAKYENVLHNVTNTAQIHEQKDLFENLVDYLELSLYSAVEHIDDINMIANSFFINSQVSAGAKETKRLKKALKPIRDRLSAFANAMKHKQARIRMFSFDASHDSNCICLHGMFIETYKNGQAGSHQIVQSADEKIISITSFLLEIVIFIFEASQALTTFLNQKAVIKNSVPSSNEKESLKDVIVALARLPNYSLDDEHPFNRVIPVINCDEATKNLMDSRLYGSIMMPWSNKNKPFICGNSVTSYLGDGATRSFEIIQLRKIEPKCWLLV